VGQICTVQCEADRVAIFREPTTALPVRESEKTSGTKGIYSNLAFISSSSISTYNSSWVFACLYLPFVNEKGFMVTHVNLYLLVT
jgi:hypothetical protein